jgi:hypothetical protein
MTLSKNEFERMMGYTPGEEGDPVDPEMLTRWGVILSEKAMGESGAEQDKLFSVAYARFKEALALQPDYYDAMLQWGAAMTLQAVLHTGARRERLLLDAKDRLIHAETLSPGSGSWLLACGSALLDNRALCEKWLLRGKKRNTLPPTEDIQAHPAFAPYQKKDWFVKLLKRL